jgi:tetratricopeptide (TPR) repeat protein
MMMKKRRIPALLSTVILLAALIALLSACTTTHGAGALSLDEAIERSAIDIADKLPPGTRVAVAAFASSHENLSAYIMDAVAGVLVGSSLEVADRNNREYVYKELGFQMSGYVSDENAQAIGKFLGARYVITGQLVDLGGRYRYHLNGINVETAVHESSTRLDVRNDQWFQELFAALQSAAPVVRTASYSGSSAPISVGTFLDRGIGFASWGEYDLAIADFTQAIALDPDMQSAWMLRGRAWYASVSHITDVDKNFSSVGTMSTAGAGVSEEKKTVYDRAIADFTQAIQLDPTYAAVYSNRGIAYAEKGDYDRAIADYNQAIQFDPTYAAAYSNRGIVYAEKGDYDRAIADYNQAIQLDPTYAAVYSNRGAAYAEKEDYDRAIADYNQAIQFDPTYAAAYSNRGLAYAEKGDYDRAIADYNQAIQLDPTYAVAYNNRGLAYANKFDLISARADWEKALQLNPDDDTARGNLDVLRSIGY